MRNWFTKLKALSVRKLSNVDPLDSATVEAAINTILEGLRNQNVSLRELRRSQLAAEERLSLVERKSQQAEQRVEFVRREILFEMAASRRSDAGGSTAKQTAVESCASLKPLIINHSKVNEAKGALRINLGCGHIPLHDYVNVDFRDLPGVDVVASAGDLPFEPGSVTEIFSAHMLEHFPLQDLRRVLLPYWVSRLKPGGIFRAIVPDADAMMRAYVSGGMSFADIAEVTFGTQEYVGDQHYTMFSQERLEQLLLQAGLTSFTMIAVGRRNGLCFEMECSAIKPIANEA